LKAGKQENFAIFVNTKAFKPGMATILKTHHYIVDGITDPIYNTFI
jgi:hypothetical protein